MPHKKSTSKTAIEATAVVLNHYPQWLMATLKTIYAKGPDREECANAYFMRASALFFEGIQIDHWGITCWHGVKNCFVTEPYGVKISDLEALKEKGKQYDFAVVHDLNSFWPKNGCQRVLIFPRYLNPYKKYAPPVLHALEEMGFSVHNEAPVPKPYTTIKSKPQDLNLFKQFINDKLRLSEIRTELKKCKVEKTDDGFKFTCSKLHQPQLDRVLKGYKRLMRDQKPNIPTFTIEVIDNQTLLPVKEHVYDSNDGPFVDALILKNVPSLASAEVENLLKRALGVELLSITSGNIDKSGELSLTIKLTKPISNKNALNLVTSLKPKVGSTETLKVFQIPI